MTGPPHITVRPSIITADEKCHDACAHIVSIFAKGMLTLCSLINCRAFPNNSQTRNNIGIFLGKCPFQFSYTSQTDRSILISQAPSTPPRSRQTPSRTAPVHPLHRTTLVKMSAQVHYLQKDRQTGFGPKESILGTISPSASSKLQFQSLTSTIQSPLWSGLRTAPGITSRTIAPHHDQMED